MTNIEKAIRQGKYYSAYNDLNGIGYVYSIEREYEKKSVN